MKILDFQIIGHLASKIQDFQLIIQVYRLDFDNLGLSIRKAWIFTLIIQVFRLIVQEKSKILDYRMKIQDFQRHMSNKSNILDYRYRLIILGGRYLLPVLYRYNFYMHEKLFLLNLLCACLSYFLSIFICSFMDTSYYIICMPIALILD